MGAAAASIGAAASAALRGRHGAAVRMAGMGAVAAASGFLSFVAVHSLLIAPIWGRAAHGIPFALVAGTALAWAYDAHAARTSAARTPIAAGVGFGATMFATLLPATAVANALRAATFRPNDWPWIFVTTAIAFMSGAIAGRRFAGRARETAVAAVALTIAMGGQIPVVNSARAAWLFAAFLPICVAAGIALASIDRRE